MSSKKIHKSPQHILSLETWTFIILTIMSVIALVHFVDLTPHVDRDFFFSQDDPDYAVEHKISALFSREDSQLIISAEGPIHSERYITKMINLTNILSDLHGVLDVKSIARGPKDLDDAIKSPLWSRLLIPHNRESTNIIILLDQHCTPALIDKIEELIYVISSEQFKLRISGFPFIVEKIRRSLMFDLRVFSTLAFIFFGIIILLIFHSWRILLGMVVTCIQAFTMTFFITTILEIKIGILTANLATIIFVLTLSHIVFLTFNWLNIHPAETDTHHHTIAYDAIIATAPASFWSMFTTLLGFSSLLFVKAQPLRELGVSGAIGTLSAFIAVFSFYPAFLRLKKPTHKRIDIRIKHYYKDAFTHVARHRGIILLLTIGGALFTMPHLKHLDVNPSLISYFAKDSAIAEGLTFIDKNGGSNPLVIVVRDAEGLTLDEKSIYPRLWTLQEELEKNKYIGSIISLPTLLAEGKRARPRLFATSKRILKHLRTGKYNKVAKSFISENGEYGLFLFRMIDADIDIHSVEIVDKIKALIHEHGFIPHLVGGSYALQGQLAKHIEASLIAGLGRLIIAFALISLIVSCSFYGMFAMTLCACLIPLCIIGGLGFLKVPFDIISAPASNVAIAMGIDFMIHIMYAYRRQKKEHTHTPHRWLTIQKLMWEPIITSMFIVASGFSIFFFSSFPPTQRFGGSIVFGTILSAAVALFVFPMLSKDRRHNKKTENNSNRLT